MRTYYEIENNEKKLNAENFDSIKFIRSRSECNSSLENKLFYKNAFVF